MRKWPSLVYVPPPLFKCHHAIFGWVKNLLGWHMCRTKLARMIFFRGVNFITKIQKFPEIVEPLFCGPKNSTNFPPNIQQKVTPKNKKKSPTIRHAETTILTNFVFLEGVGEGEIYRKLSKNAAFPGTFHDTKFGYLANFIVRNLLSFGRLLDKRHDHNLAWYLIRVLLSEGACSAIFNLRVCVTFSRGNGPSRLAHNKCSPA